LSSQAFGQRVANISKENQYGSERYTLCLP
jgi:hypothetical protein